MTRSEDAALPLGDSRAVTHAGIEPAFGVRKTPVLPIDEWASVTRGGFEPPSFAREANILAARRTSHCDVAPDTRIELACS